MLGRLRKRIALAICPQLQPMQPVFHRPRNGDVQGLSIYDGSETPVVPDITSSYGQRIAKLRGELGLTQRELAEKLSRSQGYVSDIEAGRSDPSFDFLVRLHECLAVDPSVIITGNGGSRSRASQSPDPLQKRPNLLGEDEIASLVMDLAKARGWKLTHAARMATGSGDTVARIKGGVGLTIRRAKAIIQRCSDLWPEDAIWPDGIERPTPFESEESPKC